MKPPKKIFPMFANWHVPCTTSRGGAPCAYTLRRKLVT